MNPARLVILLVVTALAGCGRPAPDERPNVLLIVADDLGYSDIGSFGSEVRTPNLDSLAAHGLKLTNFHTAPTCGPTRSMLMTGVDSHPVGMAANAAALRRVTELVGRPGYEGHLNDAAVTVASLLSDAGYQTYTAGKWDLGGVEGSRPIDRGFQRSFVLSAGGASHFADAAGLLASDKGAHYLEDDHVVEALPKDFYSSRFYADRAMRYIREGDQQKPFFAYVTFTAPHWPLQVPDDWLDRYRGRYDDGWRALAEERQARQLALGLIDKPSDYRPLPGVADWDTLPASERQFRAREMEIYAAMIEYMDWQIGRLLEFVDTLPGERETLVIFLSDNGPEGNAVDRIGNNGEWIAANFDNDVDNMGKSGSYLWLGPGWAQAAASPLTLYKSFVAEGGIRTPAIMSYERMAGPGRSSAALVTVKDIPATILDAAGVAHPGTSYKGRRIRPIEGRSALPILEGSSESIHDGEAIGFELYGNRALIRDGWKAMLIWPPAGNGAWALYRPGQDPAERNDLAEQDPQLLDELVDAWDDYADKNGIYRFEEDNGYGRY